MSALSIGEVASRVDVATSAIRYYERIGLLPRAPRESGRRRYGDEAVDLLLVIRFCQRMGFSLDEIREILAAPDSASPQQRWHELVDAKLVEVDEVIAQAQAVRRVLSASRACDCVTLETCTLVRDSACCDTDAPG